MMPDRMLLEGWCPACGTVIDASTRALAGAHARGHWPWVLWLYCRLERRRRERHRTGGEVGAPVGAGAPTA
jgi:hypothetical protein